MITLCRTARFCINPGDNPDQPIRGTNGFGAKPPMRGLGRYYELSLILRGEPDTQTGYLINIKSVDEIIRQRLIPIIARQCREAPETEPAHLLPALAQAAHAPPLTLVCLRWQLTPTLSVEATGKNMSHAILRQQFDFAAAHRLHVPSLSDEENRATFGRCNNPSGHGHNYRVETAFLLDTTHKNLPTVEQFEELVDRILIQPFDHTHLNEDTTAFATGTGVNPSVENIARVFFERLAPAADTAFGPLASLREVTVWETDRTSATYPAV